MGAHDTSVERFDIKLAASFGAVILMLIITVSVTAGLLFERLLDREENRLAGAIAATIGESISRVSFSGKHHARLLVQEMLQQVPELSYISVETPDGRILAHSDPGRNDFQLSPEDQTLARRSLEEGKAVHMEKYTDSGVVREVVAPYRGGYDARVMGVVRIGVRMQETRFAQAENQLILLTVMSVLSMASIWSVFRLSRHFGASIREFATQLQGILEHAPLGIVISDAKGRIIRQSAALTERARTGSDSLAEQAGLERIFPEGARRQLADMDELAVSGSQLTQDVEFQGDQGLSAWHVRKFPIAWSGDGEVTLLCTLLVDISETKRSELALAEERLLTDAIMECVPGLIFLYDCDGHLIRWNRFHELLSGFAPEELRNKFVLEWFTGREADIAAIRAAIEQVMREGSAEAEASLVTKDGRVIPFYFKGVRHVIGGKAYLVGIGVDLTERREAEQRLRRSEEKFSRLFRLSPDAISLLDLTTGVMADVNHAFSKLTGYSRAEAVGHTGLDLGLFVEPSHRQIILDQVERAGHVENHEFELRRKDGTVILCAASCQRVDFDDKAHLMVIVRDVSELKKMQAMMIQTEKMISVGGIAAGIAHEINNPLGIVMQASQMLAQRMDPHFPKNAETAVAVGLDLNLLEKYMEARNLRTYLKDIREAAMRASEIIRHMLDFSRTSESRRTCCNIPALIERAIDLAGSDYDLKKRYDFRKVRIVREYEDGLPSVSCTETEIEQVMLNLLRNAAQAMGDASPSPQTPQLTIRVKTKGNRLAIEVEDNGPGMSPEVRRRAFEPFFTTKPTGQRTGLGLSVSYFIVTNGHGGNMFVRNVPGSGACFVVELPLFPPGSDTTCSPDPTTLPPGR